MSTDTLKVKAPASTEALEIANERKAQGNELFKEGKWQEAITMYRSALNCIPERKAKKESPPPTSDDDISGSAEPEEDHAVEEVEEILSPEKQQEEDDFRRLRAVINANIGACFVKSNDHKSAVEACTQALLDDPLYIKALERRASSNEILNTWSSLSSAQEDYTKLATLVPPAQAAAMRRKAANLKPRVEAAQKRETDEMLGKLKGLGNTVLGKFGLSTDNFKFEPNGQGGYSVNFSR